MKTDSEWIAAYVRALDAAGWDVVSSKSSIVIQPNGSHHLLADVDIERRDGATVSTRLTMGHQFPHPLYPTVAAQWRVQDFYPVLLGTNDGMGQSVHRVELIAHPSGDMPRPAWPGFWTRLWLALGYIWRFNNE